MRRLLLIFIFVLLTTFFVLTQSNMLLLPEPDSPDTLFIPETADTNIDGWELVWHDEFNGDAIDPTNWGFHTGGSGFGNNELQYYTDSPENAFVEDGHLVIQAIEERIWGLDYSSAKLWTSDLHTWRYGRFDIRARLPYGQGIWPAIWMLPASSDYGGWPHSGEIDITELIGNQAATVHGTLHYSNDAGHQYTGSSYTLDDGIFNDDFHVFSIIWEEDQIQWFVDGELYQTQTQWQSSLADFPAPFDQEMYLILNLAVGGNWPGSPNETTSFPQQLEVDYVRVYQNADMSSGE